MKNKIKKLFEQQTTLNLEFKPSSSPLDFMYDFRHENHKQYWSGKGFGQYNPKLWFFVEYIYRTMGKKESAKIDNSYLRLSKKNSMAFYVTTGEGSLGFVYNNPQHFIFYSFGGEDASFFIDNSFKYKEAGMEYATKYHEETDYSLVSHEKYKEVTDKFFNDTGIKGF
jgi:hypothetical protein